MKKTSLATVAAQKTYIYYYWKIYNNILKEFTTRAISGILFVIVIILAAQHKLAFFGILFLFGLLTLIEFNRLIQKRNTISYFIFVLIFTLFGLWDEVFQTDKGLDEASQILQVLSIFVLIFLIRDLFSKKRLPKLLSNRYINTTFYISSGMIFLFLIANNFGDYNPHMILGMFALIWINDSSAYLVGKNFGRQKLFESISPKKTIEGFLGGVFFSALGSYLIYSYTNDLKFSYWLILSVLVSVFGTIGDLLESKYKRQAEVKDSGSLIPGHGGILDRMDSAIVAAPFVYLFLRILNYVS
ncbi:MAG: phosphatidate cytidylyltransferase [Flavobacteriaceae bacterium]|jgi:phosphatidate cytidylyltransferase